MKISDVSLGHDSNFTFLNDGKIVGIIEAERYFRVKHYKLHSITLQSGKRASGKTRMVIDDLDV